MGKRLTASGSFTVATIEDGVSVQAQYAPNSDPTSSQIHTVWMEGDLYMRTRESNDSTWSDWHRIVGESGDETDYKFGISEQKVTGSASVPPSDIADADWADAPMAVTTLKPFLWSRVQKKVWNATSQSYDIESTRYIRLTGEDGTSVIAQYAPSASPTEQQIHDTWQDGDLYMRTKPTGGNWSGWHKIVGENGNETDYKFNISDLKTGVNDSTASSHLGGAWQDTPKAVTNTFPYLWTRIVKRVWDETQQKYVDSTPSFSRLTGEQGDAGFDAPSVELSRTNILYDADKDGVSILQQDFRITYSLVVKGVSCTIANVSDIVITLPTNMSIVANTKTTSAVTLRIPNSTSVQGVVTIQMKGTQGGREYTATSTITVDSRKQGEQGKQGDYAPYIELSRVSIQYDAYKNGASTTSQNFPITYTLKINGETCSVSSADDVTINSSSSGVIVVPNTKTTSGATINVAQGGTFNAIVTVRIKGTSSDGTLYSAAASITVQPSMRGENAAVAFASPEKISIPCDSNGRVISSTSKDITFSLKVGSEDIDSITVTSQSLPSNVSVQSTSYNYVKTLVISASATSEGMANGATFVVSGSLRGTVYSALVTIALIGAEKGTGEKGKTGRFYYYAGEFDRNNTTAAFLVSDSQAPYFKNMENYYLFDYDVNGYYTMQDMYYIQNNFNFAPWVLMWNDFKYLITEAIFGNYAHFGSFIINRDWMLSQYGILVDNYGNKITVDASNVNTPFSANGALILNGNGVNNGIIVCKLSFTLSASTTVTATIIPNSESGWDFGAVGAVDSYALGDATANDIKNNRISLLVKASGTTSATATTTVSAGSHYFYVAYAKDGTGNYGTDQASISLSFASGTVYYDLSVIKITEGTSYSGGSRISVPYGWFDATDPMAETLPSSGYKFVPNYAVDGLTGATYQNSAYVRGEIRASKYYMARQKVVLDNTGTAMTEDVNEGVQIVIVESYSTNDTKNILRLPNAANNTGMVVDIYYETGSAPAFGHLVAPFQVTSKSGQVVPIRTFFVRSDYPTLSYGQHVKVYCDGYSWIVLDDMDSYSSNLRAEVASIIQELRTNTLKSLGASYVALPDNIKTSSFILPESPSDGMVIFCKGVTNDLTITTRSHPITWANSRDNQTAANSSVNIGDDSVILVFSSTAGTAGKWIRFDCY